MASFPLDDIYPGVGDPNAKHPQSFGPRGDAGNGINCVGIIWHTTEYGANDWSRNQAVRVAQDQSNGQLGSYNWIIYDARATPDKGGALLTVPYLEASGGINPQSAFWAPQAALKQMLGAKVYSDPARYMIQVAFQGDTAQAGAFPPNMIDTAAKLTLWIEAQEWASDTLVHVGHLHFQTNRKDPSQGAINAIVARRAAILAEQAPPAPPAFTDVPPGHKFFDALQWANKEGIAFPFADGTFKPDSNATRGQVIQFLYRANKEPS